MATGTEQLVDSLESLTLHAFEAFCQDIVSMFGNAAECSAFSAGQGCLSDLKKEFKKLASVNHVKASGVLDGEFHLLLDQAGLFVMGGVFVMLPEKRVFETIRNGTLKDADHINDAIKEVGNLLVGSWDRVFREEQKGHKHFAQTGTFVGSIWDNPTESIGLSVDQSCRYVICQIKVDDFPEFKCAAIFSEQLFAPESKPQTVQAAEPDNGEKPQPGSELSATSSDIATSCDTSPGDVDAAAILIEQNPGPVTQAIRQITQNTESIRSVTEANLLHLPAGQIMNPAVVWVDPEDTVEEVLRQMQQYNVGYVLAGRDGQISGIVSRSDIAAALSPYTRSVFSAWRRPLDDATLQIRIKWFMSRPVHTARSDTLLQSVIETMMRHSVRGLPVVDPNGQTVGLITIYDILRNLLGSSGIVTVSEPCQSPPGVQ